MLPVVVVPKILASTSFGLFLPAAAIYLAARESGLVKVAKCRAEGIVSTFLAVGCGGLLLQQAPYHNLDSSASGSVMVSVKFGRFFCFGGADEGGTREVCRPRSKKRSDALAVVTKTERHTHRPLYDSHTLGGLWRNASVVV